MSTEERDLDDLVDDDYEDDEEDEKYDGPEEIDESDPTFMGQGEGVIQWSNHWSEVGSVICQLSEILKGESEIDWVKVAKGNKTLEDMLPGLQDLQNADDLGGLLGFLPGVDAFNEHIMADMPGASQIWTRVWVSEENIEECRRILAAMSDRLCEVYDV